MKQLVLNMINKGLTTPLFLREVGRYYWNLRLLHTEYGLKIQDCVKNRYNKTFKFFDPRMILGVACYYDVPDIVEKYRDFWDIYAFRCACMNNKIKTARKILKTLGLTEIDSYTFRIACEKGYFRVVKLLLKYKCPEAPRQDLLGIACEKGYFRIVKLLIENGTPVDERVLCQAKFSGRINIYNYLVEQLG